ncbi:hypothetical protein TSUD_386930 [Trifolium subterraneum]|uniref:RRM domain-containing protein n=1 Tax=Trifolium subterraneum TaxID=3900 RepID=A0A2Z6NU14_TRISU|nr:hypothetical protein TSUD_386930 [Trifolium subterraneum]
MSLGFAALLLETNFYNFSGFGNAAKNQATSNPTNTVFGGEGSRARPSGFVHRLNQEATSYFITNFPEEVKVVDLWARFARFGRVGEVYIPNKVDKQGHRFGFVKFREVSDAKELLRRISDIWMGSFRLRVNLAKPRKNALPLADMGEQRKDSPKAKVQNHASVERSFKNALVSESMEGEVVGCYQGTVDGAQRRSGVVWEVEVEDEVVTKLGGAYVGYLVVDMDAITIQNQFRMDGFQTLKVVPWSSALVSNQRVTWIRCFGVPLHAWGVDLFRAITFKFGRFIYIDEQTKLMSRCDVARVKISSGETKLIDSSMEVKVQGQRFGIRIVEELGGWEVGGRCSCRRRDEEDDCLSKASSYGGASVVAVAERLSETDSDADVSESCQMLLEVGKRGGGGKGIVGSVGVSKDNRGGESDFNPNLLGKPEKLVEVLVNSDGDKRKGLTLVESAGADSTAVRDCVGSPLDPFKGTTCDAIGFVEDRDDVVCQTSVGIPVEVCGPAHCGKDVPLCISVKGGKELQGRGLPQVLRTKKGDLNVFGLTNSGPSNYPFEVQADLENENTQAQVVDSIESLDTGHDLTEGVGSNLGAGKVTKEFQFRSKKVQNKHLPSKNFSNLPLNMLRKLPGSFYGARKVKKRRGPSKGRGCKIGEASISVSDPILCSGEGVTQTMSANNDPANAGFELEVVLPFQSGEGQRRSSSGLVGDPGAGILVEGGGFVVEDSSIGGGLNYLGENNQLRSKEVIEAKKLIAINEELGLTFYDCEGEDVERMR